MNPKCAGCGRYNTFKLPKESYQLDDMYKCSDCGVITSVYNSDARRKREI